MLCGSADWFTPPAPPSPFPRFFDNVADLFGGAIMVSGTSTLSLSDSRLERNKAGKYRVGTGGGVTVNAEASIRLKDTVVTRNHATRHGGGIRVLSDHFNSVEVADAADGRGNTALYDGAHDVSYAPRKLEIVSHNAEGGFVPELRASLQVNVSVTGPQGRPTAGEDVEATMLEADGKVVQVSCYNII